jgi:DNA processing protein
MNSTIDRWKGSEEREAVLALALTPGVGSVAYRRLTEVLGSAEAVLNASQSMLLSVPGIGPATAEAIRNQNRDRQKIVRLCVKACEFTSIDFLVLGDSDYPPVLLETTDPPPLLFVKGNRLALSAFSVAIVGSRHATRYGLKVADRLSRDLCAGGITVVSGLARGIDGAAHRAAIEAQGQTVAVLGGGLDRVHPSEHLSLAAQITQQGCLVGEHPPGFPPKGGVFPQRNRVIAGLCPAVIVVEAGLRSGALITARHALEQNRDVFAVPGPVDSAVSRGCHQLLKDGAHLIESADDLFELLGPLGYALPDANGHPIAHTVELTLNAQERLILEAINEPTLAIDSLIRATGIVPSRVIATIAALETRGLVRRHSGATVSRTHPTTRAPHTPK